MNLFQLPKSFHNQISPRILKPTNTSSKIKLNFKKINGKLPNMDLFDLAVLLTEKAGAIPTVHKITRARNHFNFRGAANTFLNGIISLVCLFKLTY